MISLLLAAAVAAPLIVEPVSLRKAMPASFTILDARHGRAYREGHIPGAVPVNWLDYRDGLFRSGSLPSDLERLARKLEAKGVDSGRPVVVYGAARDGWGEEGRIAWMLHYLGHPDVRVLDGGFAAWLAAGGTSSKDEVGRALRGRFSIHPRGDVRARAEDVASAASRGVVVLDVRSDEEWRGAKKYFEKRGGHIPGAVHLEWRTFLDATGRFDRTDALRERLARIGIGPTTPVILYCTGGVRSAETFVALRALGHTDVRNYDASFWEWSSDKRRPVSSAP